MFSKALGCFGLLELLGSILCFLDHKTFLSSTAAMRSSEVDVYFTVRVVVLSLFRGGLVVRFQIILRSWSCVETFYVSSSKNISEQCCSTLLKIEEAEGFGRSKK